MSDNEKVLYLNYIDYFEKANKKGPRIQRFFYLTMSRQGIHFMIL